MNQIPKSPFATRLSGSAKEAELRIRNIFQWKKKRPPVVLMLLTALTVLLCCGLVSCQPSGEEPSGDLSELRHVDPKTLAQDDVQPIQPFQQAETKVAAVISLADIETYTPVNMEPDTVSADTMGDILCEKTLPDGTRVVCYWEPGSEYTKYWAIRQGDSLLRFCREDSGYGAGSYDVESFTDVLGYDGFRIHAARGAAYDAYDYYIVDEDGVPRLLADCANQVLETDADGDGETELIYFYHDGELIVYYFRLNGQVCQADITETLREQDGIQARAENVESWTDSNFPVSILRDASALPSENNSWQRAFLRFTPETIELCISGVPISDLVIAEGETELKDLTSVTVKLVMQEGTYLTEEETGWGGGFGPESYVGSCELQVWQGDTMLTDYALEGEGDVDMLYNFTGFPLCFDDYNGDGNPDFTIGQYGSSNFNIYSLFTLDEDAAIRPISGPYGILSTDGKANGAYSTLLTKTPNGFVVSVYNNATGETEQAYYAWDAASGQFLQ